MEEKELKNKEEKLVYKRREDGAIITDQQEIAMYLTFQKQEILSNMLLGVFDTNGQYSINSTFLKELVACNKIIKENFDNSYLIICRSSRGVKFNLKFVLSIQKIENDNKKVATLKLIEDVVKLDGESKERISTVVAKYKDDDDIYFFRKVKKIFNLSSIDESEGKDEVDESLITEILKKQLSLKETHSKTDVFSNEISKLYIDKILKIMINSGLYGKFVLTEYEKLFASMRDQISKPGAYRKLLYKLYGLLSEADKRYKLEEEQKKLLMLAINQFLSANQTMFTEVNKLPVEKKVESSKSKSAGGKVASKKSAAKKKAQAKKAENNVKAKDSDSDEEKLIMEKRKIVDVEEEIEKEEKKLGLNDKNEYKKNIDSESKNDKQKFSLDFPLGVFDEKKENTKSEVHQNQNNNLKLDRGMEQ